MPNVTTNTPGPAQPSTSSYPSGALQLFSQYTRASYLAAFGTDPATYDPARKPKDWFDSSLKGAPTDMVTYNFVDTSTPGTPVINTIQMMVAEASVVNLPGVHSYPAYTIDPTVATETMVGAPPQQLNPATLSTQAQAAALATAWGLSDSAINQWTPGGPIVFTWGSEMRRVFQIAYGAYQLNVGQYVALMNANGIGAPGHWVFTGPQPVWVTLLPASVPVVLQPWPEPVRALLPNEALWSGLFGGSVVYRTDMTSNYNPAPAVVGGGLTAAQDARLTRIEADIAALDRSLGIPPAA